jgi:hypothetical protein
MPKPKAAFSVETAVSMADNKVLIFPKRKKNPSFDPVVELTHQLLGLLAGTRLLAKLNVAALEMFGLEVILWSAAYRTSMDLIFSLIDETIGMRDRWNK